MYGQLSNEMELDQLQLVVDGKEWSDGSYGSTFSPGKPSVEIDFVETGFETDRFDGFLNSLTTFKGHCANHFPVNCADSSNPPSSTRSIMFPTFPSTYTPLDTSPITSDSHSVSSSAVPSIRIHLWAHHHLNASINPHNGKFELKGEGEITAARENRLNNAGDKIEKDLGIAGETINRIRRSVSVLE